MKIAVCGDGKDELLFISSIINTCRQEQRVSLRCDALHSATALLHLTKSSTYARYLSAVMRNYAKAREAYITQLFAKKGAK